MATMTQASRVLEAFESQLLENPNVAFISVVPGKKSLDLDDDTEFHLQVGVYDVEKQVSQFDAMPDDTLDISQVIPASLSTDDEEQAVDVPIEIVGTEEITALSYTDNRRPAGGGNSTSVHNLGGSGTLGSKVAVNGQEGFYITNWHVAHGGNATGGAAQIQRGFGDGGRSPTDKIGGLHWWALSQYLDAAIVKADTANLLTYTLRCWGNRIAGFESPVNGMRVKKCGRTTRATTGTVVSSSATVRVSGYPSGTRVFRDQIQMTFMLRPGDSGSILLSGNNKAVGLCFAGSSSQSFANKFRRLNDAAAEGNSIEPDGTIIAGDPVTIGWGSDSN